jgi:hypothetical protein
VIATPTPTDVSRYGRGPFVHARRKGRFNECDEARCLAKGLRDMAGIDVPTPIISPEGKILALAWGERPELRSPRVNYIDEPHLIRELLLTPTTYDLLIAAATNGLQWPAKLVKTATTNPVAGQYMDLWPVGGDPTAGAYGGAAYTAVQKSDATTGALQHGGNVSTSTKHVAAATAAFNAGATPPTLYLYDRVLTYEACSFNANVNQAFTNGVAPARYVSAGQGGLKVMFTCQTVFGATAANLTTFQYTDQDGNATQSMPTSPTALIIVSCAAPTATLGARVACPAVGTTPFGPYLFMAAGDSGVRQATNFTTSAANTGTICFVLARQLAVFPMVVAGKTEDFDLTRGLQALPRIIDGACLTAFAKFPAATGCNFELDIVPVWG